MKKIAMLTAILSAGVFADAPRHNNDPHSVTHTGVHTFKGGFTVAPAGTDDYTITTDSDSSLVVSGLSDVSGDAMCVSSGNVVGTCAAAVFTTSISSPALISPLTGGADDITFKPAGTLGMTLAETTNNLTVVGDITASGADMFATNFNGSNFQSTATGGADDLALKPAGTVKFTVAEAGQVQINGVVSSHSACAAAGDIGKIEMFSVADTVSFCGCWQSGAGTYAWVGLHTGAVCS